MPSILDPHLYPLALRSNHSLGAGLVELGLITYSELDRALELLQEPQSGEFLVEQSLIEILKNDLRLLDEQRVMECLAMSEDLQVYQSSELEALESTLFSLQECQATWTIPFDCVDGVWRLASAHYVSAFVRSFWKDRLGAQIRWYIADTQSISRAFSLVS
ncbi:MAG: hypothetical protein ACPGN3_03500 [Opitutales bacterium]